MILCSYKNLCVNEFVEFKNIYNAWANILNVTNESLIQLLQSYYNNNMNKFIQIQIKKDILEILSEDNINLSYLSHIHSSEMSEEELKIYNEIREYCSAKHIIQHFPYLLYANDRD